MSGFTSVGLNRRSVRYRRKLPSPSILFSPFFLPVLSPLSKSVARNFASLAARGRHFRSRVAVSRCRESASIVEDSFDEESDEETMIRRFVTLAQADHLVGPSRTRVRSERPLRHPRGDVADGNEQCPLVFHLYTSIKRL